MDAPAGLTGQQRGCLQKIRRREEACFRARIPKSLALGSKARESMPGGVPMAWMASFYWTPPPWVSRGQGAGSPMSMATATLTSMSAACRRCWVMRILAWPR